VVIPGRQKVVAICSYVADDISEFVRGKPHIHGDGQIVKPEFDFFVSGTHVNVRRLVSFIGIEECTIRTPP
jgi:hypothetical protein